MVFSVSINMYFVDFIFILGFVLICLNLRFCLWLYFFEVNWMLKWIDFVLIDVICKCIVWDVVLNFDLY